MEHWYRIQSALLASIICATLAGNLLLRGRKNKLYAGFAVFNLNLVALFLVDLLALSETISVYWGQVSLGVVAGLLPLTTVGFFVEFADERSRFAHLAHRLALGCSGLLVLAALFRWPASSVWREALLSVAIFAGVIVSNVILIRRYRIVESPIDKARLKVLIVVGLTVFTLALASYLPEVDYTALSNILLATYMFFMFEIITLRRLIDLFEFVGRFLVLTGFAVVLSLIYAVLVGWWRHDFNLFLLNTVIATLVILILFDPLREFVEQKLNELVFREKFEFTKRLDELRQGMASVIDVQELASLVTARLEASRRVTQASFWLVDEDGLGYSTLSHVGAEPPQRLDLMTSRPFLDRLARDRVLVIENLDAERGHMVRSSQTSEGLALEALDQVIASCHAIQSGLCVGFMSSAQEASPLVGFVSVRDDRLRGAYSSDEIRALATLAAQCTITVENSRLFDGVRERYRLAALGEMAAGLAHEIRNPLGAIKGAAQLLTDTGDENEPYIGIIEEEIHRLNGVVGQFLNYARPLKGRFDEVDINHVLERTLTLLHAEAPDASIDFEPDTDLAPIRTDAELLRQVAINLAKNAVEAMEGTDGRLAISTSTCWRRAERAGGAAGGREQVEHVRIRFADEGPGIAPEVLERLFIPFFTTKTKGTGLGLAICQRIVRSLGGAMEVSSRLEEGAVFTIYLPIEPAQTRASNA